MTKPYLWLGGNAKAVPIKTEDAGDNSVALSVSPLGIGSSDDKILLLIGADGRATPVRCVYNGDDPPTYSLSVAGISIGELIEAGDGLVLVGDALNIVPLDDSIDVQADGIRVNPDLQRPYYEQVVGDGVNNRLEITHNLGTKSVTATVYRVSDPWEDIEVGIERITDNSIIIHADPPLELNSYTVRVER